MSLSSVTTGCMSPAAKIGFQTGNKLKNGASIADIKNEAKEKIGNDFDTFKKVAKTTTVTGLVGAATVTATKTGLAGKIAGLVPEKLKTTVTDTIKNATSDNKIIKTLAKASVNAFGTVKSFATAHPVATAVLALIGGIGTAAIHKAKENGAKEEGKIEQKYADILELRNNAAKDLA